MTSPSTTAELPPPLTPFTENSAVSSKPTEARPTGLPPPNSGLDASFVRATPGRSPNRTGSPDTGVAGSVQATDMRRLPSKMTFLAMVSGPLHGLVAEDAAAAGGRFLRVELAGLVGGAERPVGGGGCGG